jgi:hypothetical protein
MKKLGAFMVAGSICAAVGCASAGGPQANTQIASAHCVGLEDVHRQVADMYRADRVEYVKPLYREVFVARAVQRKYVAGAELYLRPQQGWSAPYLDRVLSCHAGSEASVHPNDPLRVFNFERVVVRARGPHFIVTITGVDREAGEEIYQRARALRDPSSQVEVRQLSAHDLPSRM